jgi:2-dehydro-3-deoxyphosphooctonate aldolase (KDO 8-P synthase)
MPFDFASGVAICGARPHLVRDLYHSAGSPARASLRRLSMTPRLPALIGPHQCGPGQPLLVIAGPCVIESASLCLQIGEALAALARRLPIQVIFKASFDKANRTSAGAFRGVGLDEGLAVLETVRRATGLPVTTDIHLPEQAAPVGRICDLLQIPAFLCRQTDLLLAAAATGRAVNVKKGQFLAPADMKHPIAKLLAGGCQDICLCERGTFFGYGRLVNDFAGLVTMRSFGVPVIFDATHSVQQPASLGGATGGDRALVEPLARAAAAVGIDGVFFETHPDPDTSPSDGPNMVPLDRLEGVLERVLRIHEARRTCCETEAGPTA